MTRALRSLCAWCGRVLREGIEPVPITHGICTDCMQIVFQSHPKLVQDTPTDRTLDSDIAEDR